VGVAIVAFLVDERGGIDYGRIVQNVSPPPDRRGHQIVAIGLAFGGWATIAPSANAWTPIRPTPVSPGLDAASLYRLLVALAIAQVGRSPPRMREQHHLHRRR
jgi:hypothetical protein